MDSLNKNTDSNKDVKSTAPSKVSLPLIIFIITVIVIIIGWFFSKGEVVVPVHIEESKKESVVKIKTDIVEPIVLAPIIEDEVLIEEELPKEEIKSYLPMLNESDNWLKDKLPTLTWRKELLKLVIDDDMIRRFVVFTDNFSQGIVAYEHSPFIIPNTVFSPDKENVSFENNQNVWQWSESSSKRFGLYVELLRSFDSANLVQWYMEIKPLIDEAYAELGYDDDFTNVLQDAITRVLDMELPKSSMAIIRPSVMYQYQDSTLESLPDTEKLLLRLGKENLLVIKSVLLELNEKLAQQQNGIH